MIGATSRTSEGPARILTPDAGALARDCALMPPAYRVVAVAAVALGGF